MQMISVAVVWTLGLSQSRCRMELYLASRHARNTREIQTRGENRNGLASVMKALTAGADSSGSPDQGQTERLGVQRAMSRSSLSKWLGKVLRIHISDEFQTAFGSSC